MKGPIALVAVALTFIGYVPYLRDTVKGKTTPHVYTWFIWGLVTAIAFALQVSVHAGFGSLVTLSATIVCFIVFGFGMRQGEKGITKLDTIFFIGALLALVVWLGTDQPTVSAILVSTIDMLGFVPTIRKSWNKPYQETLISYSTNTFRFALAIYALDRYSLISTLYPSTWLAANGLFSLFLVVRRGQVGAPPEVAVDGPAH